ncbi:hypothetical protein [Cupriavidus necator]
MQVELFADQVVEMMDIYRDTIDLKVPIKDEFKVHFMQRRRDILTNFSHNGKAWSLLLQCMKPSEDPAEFDALTMQVKEFRDWADAELRKLDAR